MKSAKWSEIARLTMARWLRAETRPGASREARNIFQIEEDLKMTVRELMEILEMFDEDAEVKLAYQPSWPLCTAVASVKKKDGVVYVCESGYGGNDYAPHCLFESDEYVDLDEGAEEEE